MKKIAAAIAVCAVLAASALSKVPPKVVKMSASEWDVVKTHVDSKGCHLFEQDNVLLVVTNGLPDVEWAMTNFPEPLGSWPKSIVVPERRGEPGPYGGQTF